MSIKRLFKYLVLTVLGLLVLYVGSRLGMNYTGYCFEQQRYLTDQEKINVVIDHILGRYPPILKIHEKINDDQWGIRLLENPIFYNSKEEFLEVNKDCCKVVDYIKWDTGHPGDKVPFFSRLSGRISSYIYARYQTRYRNSEGNFQKKDSKEYYAISNCGRIVRPY